MPVISLRKIIIIFALFNVLVFNIYALEHEVKLQLDHEKISELLNSDLTKHGISHRIDTELQVIAGNNIEKLAHLRQLSHTLRLYYLSAISDDKEETHKYGRKLAAQNSCIIDIYSNEDPVSTIREVKRIVVNDEISIMNAGVRADSRMSGTLIGSDNKDQCDFE